MREVVSGQWRAWQTEGLLGTGDGGVVAEREEGAGAHGGGGGGARGEDAVERGGTRRAGARAARDGRRERGGRDAAAQALERARGLLAQLGRPAPEHRVKHCRHQLAVGGSHARM